MIKLFPSRFLWGKRRARKSAPKTDKGARIPKSVPSHKSPPQSDRRENEIPKCWENKWNPKMLGFFFLNFSTFSKKYFLEIIWRFSKKIRRFSKKWKLFEDFQKNKKIFKKYVLEIIWRFSKKQEDFSLTGKSKKNSVFIKKKPFLQFLAPASPF